MEASAITVSNCISDELGFGIQDSFYRTGQFIQGEWYQFSEPMLYGAFPYEFTGGKATTFSSYGSNKSNYYRMRG